MCTDFISVKHHLKTALHKLLNSNLKHQLLHERHKKGTPFNTHSQILSKLISVKLTHLCREAQAVLVSTKQQWNGSNK